MAWITETKSENPALISFLKKQEHRCVSLTSRLLNGRKDPLFERKPGILLNTRSTGEIAGVLYLSPLGTILPVFTGETTISESERKEIGGYTRRFLKRYHSIIGTAEDVAKTEAILSAVPVSKNKYVLMAKDGSNIPSIETEHHSEICIRRAVLKDIRELYPLQKNYEIEEVLVHPERFNPNSCLANLKHSLSRQIVLCAEADAAIVAKGGTNGLGFSYYQIGGIYTLPRYRNMGISTALGVRLIREITSLGKKACLFVKIENTPALKVYQKLGFDTREDFAVSYFF